MTFCVSVPVLSVQTTVALAMVSHAPRTRTRRFIFVIRLVANARARVTASGRPSGTATTTWSRDTIKARSVRPYSRRGRERETYDSNSNNEDIYKRSPLLRGRPGRHARSELDKEPDHERAKQDRSCDRTEDGDELCEGVELELEWGRGGVSSEGCGVVANRYDKSQTEDPE